MTLIQRLSQQPRPIIFAASVSLVALLGVLDFVTGAQVSFSVFYLLPISLVTWLLDWRAGSLVATFGVATWLIADLLSGASFSDALTPYWNAGVRFTFFMVVIYLESALKNLQHNLEARVENRTARLVAEIAERQRADQRLQQYAERLEILHEIDQAILNAQSLQASAQRVAFSILKLLPCQRASISLLDFQAGQVLTFAAEVDGHAGGHSTERRLPLEVSGATARLLDALKRGEAQLVPDLQQLPLDAALTCARAAGGFRSALSMPIVAQDELIGVLHLLAHQSDAFRPEHVEIAREVANQLGVAIRDARLWDQLQNSREELQSLSRRLLAVQEAERRQVARELHDEIGQALTGLSLTLEMIGRLPGQAAAQPLKEARLMVVDLMDRVSNLSLELRPAMLDDLGLLPTLLWHIKRYSAQTRVAVAFQHSGLENQRFAPECETTAYRIIQEALTNIARHAGVLEARVTLWVDQGVLGLQVEDRGVGFDPEAMLAAGSSSGLASMRERARLLGGKLTIESAPESGTRVMADLPIGPAGHRLAGGLE